MQRTFLFQRGICPICERDLDDVGAVHIDHDHNSGTVRGLLCSRCNNGLGMFEESIEVLNKAIKYLKHPPFKRKDQDNKEI